MAGCSRLFGIWAEDRATQGCDHVYERVKPQKGIYYFTEGASGSLRAGNLKKNSALTAAGFDQDCSFMLVEIAGADLYFQTVSRTGRTVDSGVIQRATAAGRPASSPAEQVAPAAPGK